MGTNLFNDWSEAKGKVRWRTASPHPNIDYFVSPVELPKCANNQSHLYNDFSMEDVEEYLRQQVAILRFNNPDYTRDMVLAVVSGRLINWPGNIGIRKDPYVVKTLVPLVVDEVYDMEGYTSLIIGMEFTRHWYSDAVESIPNNKVDGKWGEKTRVKRKLQSQAMAEARRENLKEASDEYREFMYNILPTVKDLSEATTYSVPTVNKYGNGLYISKRENTQQKIMKFRAVFPEKSQKEVSEELEISLRTVKTYWNA